MKNDDARNSEIIRELTAELEYLYTAIKNIKTEIKAIQKEDLECDGCSDMGMVLDIIDKYIGE
jgi:prefoldin subunit 5